VQLDDDLLVKDQYEYNKDLSNISQAFSENITGDENKLPYYRPLLRLSFMFDAQFGEKNIYFMSHLTNIVLHMIAMCLLYIFLRRLNIEKMTAFVFTLFFAVHPLATQTVSLIVGRNDSLLTIFVLGSFIYLIDIIKEDNKKKYLLHILLLLLALFTKETAVMLPFVFGVYLLTFVGWRTLWEERKKYLYLAGSWLLSLVIYFLIRHSIFTEILDPKYNFFTSIYENSLSLVAAIGKIFLPFNLSVFPILLDMSLIYGLIVISIFSVCLFFSKEKRVSMLIFGISWFLFFIALTLLVPIGKTADFSENRIYLPMLGFIFIILGMGKIEFLSKVFQKNFENPRKTFFILLTIVLIFFSVKTLNRNNVYTNELTFWKNAVKTSPNSYSNHYTLGMVYDVHGDTENAIKELEEALKIQPQEKFIHNNLGVLYEKNRNTVKAEEYFLKEIAINPKDDQVYFNLGMLYYRGKKIKEAEEYWIKTIKINPNNSSAYFNLAVLYYKQNKFNKFATYAKEAQNKGKELPVYVLEALNKKR
jgi:Flp pilus assembly protein TadD